MAIDINCIYDVGRIFRLGHKCTFIMICFSNWPLCVQQNKDATMSTEAFKCQWAQWEINQHLTWRSAYIKWPVCHNEKLSYPNVLCYNQSQLWNQCWYLQWYYINTNNYYKIATASFGMLQYWFCYTVIKHFYYHSMIKSIWYTAKYTIE